MHCVVDTSYLVEIFAIDGLTVPGIRERLLQRMEAENQNGGRFYVPVPVIFEVCNHIAGVPGGGRRLQLASQIRDAVVNSLDTQAPWIISPVGQNMLESWAEALQAAVQQFHVEYSAREIGLTDVAVIREAQKLFVHLQRAPLPRSCVHIWTNDRQLKAHEPDNEANALLW